MSLESWILFLRYTRFPLPDRGNILIDHSREFSFFIQPISISGVRQGHVRRDPSGSARRCIRTRVCSRGCVQRIVDQDALRSALEVFVLSAGKRPQEEAERDHPEEQRGGDDGSGFRHLRHQVRRSAFNVTSNDELAINAAASSGVTLPVAASGIAITL